MQEAAAIGARTTAVTRLGEPSSGIQSNAQRFGDKVRSALFSEEAEPEVLQDLPAWCTIPATQGAQIGNSGLSEIAGILSAGKLLSFEGSGPAGHAPTVGRLSKPIHN